MTEEITPPTREQMTRSMFVEEDTLEKGKSGRTIVIGKAYRRKPMVDILAEQFLFSDAEHKALKDYRHYADVADRSPLRDSLATLMRISGSGDPPGHEYLNAVRMRDDCERAAGSLRDILRAVIVDDMSLSQWAMHQAGAIEECETIRGKKSCRMKPRRKALDIARLDIQMAAKRVEAELSS